MHIIFDLPTHAQDVQQPIEKIFKFLHLQENRKSQKISGVFW